MTAKNKTIRCRTSELPQNKQTAQKNTKIANQAINWHRNSTGVSFVFS